MGEPLEADKILEDSSTKEWELRTNEKSVNQLELNQLEVVKTSSLIEPVLQRPTSKHHNDPIPKEPVINIANPNESISSKPIQIEPLQMEPVPKVSGTEESKFLPPEIANIEKIIPESDSDSSNSSSGSSSSESDDSSSEEDEDEKRDKDVKRDKPEEIVIEDDDSPPSIVESHAENIMCIENQQNVCQNSTTAVNDNKPDEEILEEGKEQLDILTKVDKPEVVMLDSLDDESSIKDLPKDKIIELESEPEKISICSPAPENQEKKKIGRPRTKVESGVKPIVRRKNSVIA